MPPKKRQAKKFVYVLTLRTLPFCGDQDDEVHEIAAIYASKAAAVEDSGGIHTRWGTFDQLIEEHKEDSKDDWIDNRKNPPDDGCLLKVTHIDSDYCDFEYAELTIEKFQLHGEAATARKKKAK